MHRGILPAPDANPTDRAIPGIALYLLERLFIRTVVSLRVELSTGLRW